MKLQSTKNYEQFTKNDEQRDMDQKHVDKIAESIKENGFMPSKPVQVYKKDNKFVIVDGHHRFEASKKLGRPFYYVVEPEACQSMMAVENKLVKKWTGIDYVRLYAIRGNKDYQILLSYVNKGIPVMIASSLLYGQGADSGNVVKYIPLEKFKVKTTVCIDSVLKILNKYGPFNSACQSRLFISALSKCLQWDGFDLDHFDKRMEHYSGLIKKTPDVDQMLSQVELVYNYKMKNKIAVKIPVQESVRKRSFRTEY